MSCCECRLVLPVRDLTVSDTSDQETRHVNCLQHWHQIRPVTHEGPLERKSKIIASLLEHKVGTSHAGEAWTRITIIDDVTVGDFIVLHDSVEECESHNFPSWWPHRCKRSCMPSTREKRVLCFFVWVRFRRPTFQNKKDLSFLQKCHLF